ncbi:MULTISPECIES: nicotinamide-nucleotide adenylyltransferase [Salinibaculum]|uniref:nicotinamide-nucleotide adenylyltransferase n=1 Tax=Salinibaculum TaxID=2732368 RepID=UPI0030CDB46E
METTRGFLVGRFQPFHSGHRQLVADIAGEVDELVIGIGSADASHTVHNPFTAGERLVMISKVLTDVDLQTYVVPLEDIDRNAVWVSHVESMCPPFDVVYSNNPLVIRLFNEADYEVRDSAMIDRDRLRGTLIREDIVDGESWTDRVPPAVVETIEEIDGVARLRRIADSDAHED